MTLIKRSLRKATKLQQEVDAAMHALEARYGDSSEGTLAENIREAIHGFNQASAGLEIVIERLTNPLDV